MLWKTILLCFLIGTTFAAKEDNSNEEDLVDSSETINNSKREAAISTSYGPPSSEDKEPAPVYGPPSHSSSLSSSSAPSSYSKSIPAAAIRNVETVAVTKTITPVVTKTTTYNTHSEPALSIGHVQGYSHSQSGQPKIAPVQFQTQYTSYHNPTVGVNGPVTYTGPAVVVGGGYAIPLTGLSSYATAANGQTGFTLSSLSAGSASGKGGSPSPVYGPPSESSGAPASTYGPPGQTAGTPLGSYSMSVPQYVAVRPSTSSASSPQHSFSLHNIQEMQKLRAPAPFSSQQQFSASAISPVAIRPAMSSPYAFYQPRPIAALPHRFYQQQPQASPSTSYGTALRYQPQQQQHQLLQQLQAAQSIYQQQYRQASPPQLYHPHHQQQHQPLAQPSVRQYVQTYAMPSVSFTRLQPVSSVDNLSPSQQAQIIKALQRRQYN